MVLPLALAGASLGLSAAGAGMSYFGKRSAAKRKARAIKQARAQGEAINRTEMAAENTAGTARDDSLMGYLSGMGTAQATGADAAAARRASISTSAGTNGDGLGTSNDGLASALYRQAMAKDAQARGAEDAGQVVSLGQRAVGNRALSANAQASNAAVPLANARYNAQLQRMQLQEWLDDQLGRTTNREANMDLFGNLLSAGGNAAGTFAGMA